jgi:hypothetical protein
MELVLNLAWVLLAACMFGLWLRHCPRASGDRRMQLVALAVLLLILFPVISVTDDLQAIQNAAETDCCQRRSHACSGPHPLCASTAAMPLPAFAGVTLAVLRVAVPAGPADPHPDDPALHPVQSRPPPSA